jgi:hypothetical protein
VSKLQLGNQVTSNDGITALHYAAAGGHVRCIQLLLDNDVPINLTDSLGDTALHYAAKRNMRAAVAYLLFCKANPNLQNKTGATPLHHAARSDAYDAALLLLENGARLDLKDRDKQSAYAIAKQSGSAHLCKLLKFATKEVRRSHYSPVLAPFTHRHSTYVEGRRNCQGSGPAGRFPASGACCQRGPWWRYRRPCDRRLCPASRT